MKDNADPKARTGSNILYHVRGYHPADGGWFWMKTDEDGTVVRAAPPEGGGSIAGRVKTGSRPSSGHEATSLAVGVTGRPMRSLTSARVLEHATGPIHAVRMT